MRALWFAVFISIFSHIQPASALDEVFEKPREVGEWGKQLVQYFVDDELGYRRSYALVIGISEYEHFASLPTSMDPIRVKDYLLDEAGFDYVHLLTEEDATPSRIRALMEDDFTRRVGREDRFVFYWSGHGHTQEDRFANKLGYLPTAKAGNSQTSQMVSMERLREWDQRLVAKQVVYLLDSCFSGHAGSRAQSYARKLSLSVMAKPSRHILTAGTAEEETIALNQLEGSVFTHALLEGLRGGAEVDGRFEPDGLISMNELERFVQLRVEELRRQAGWRKSITPKLWDFGSNAGEFFFVSPTVKTAALSDQGLEFAGTFQHGVPMSVGMSLNEAQTRQEAARLAREIVVLEGLLERERGAKSDVAAEARVLKREIRKLEIEIEDYQAGEENLQRSLDVALEERQSIESSLQDKDAALKKQLALLASAKETLQFEQERSSQAERQTELLNQQVVALRSQLGQLQGLLDEAAERDAEREVQLQSLGSHLNTALARVAAEERKRRQLEEAERHRLEEETAFLVRRLDPLYDLRQEFLALSKDALEKIPGARISGERVLLDTQQLFLPARSELSESGERQVFQVARSLSNVLSGVDDQVDWVLQVDGHTDSVPLGSRREFEDNWELSQARSLSVLRYIVNVVGLPPERLSANGFGEHQPIADNATSQGRASNRRIEFRLIQR